MADRSGVDVAVPAVSARPPLIVYVVIAFATGSIDSIAEPFRNPALWPYLLFAGLLGAGLPALLFLVAIRLIGPVRTGILAMFEPHWADAIDTALSGASKVRKEQVDADSAGESRPRPRRTRRLRPRSAGSSPTVLAPDPQLGWGQQGR
jgi:hypothetical protein